MAATAAPPDWRRLKTVLEFLWPWVWLLLPLPLAAVFFGHRHRAPARGALYVPDFADFCDLGSGQGDWKGWRTLFFPLPLWLIWLLLLAACSRPVWFGEPIEIPREGRDIFLALDISGSMRERDMVLGGRRVDRLTAVKQVVGEFTESRTGDRIGLILFGSQAFLQSPLTYDLNALKVFVDEAVIGLAGEKTAIGDAIGMALKHSADDEEERDQVLILLTDGLSNAGRTDPRDAARLSVEKGLKIYTIGIGSSGRGSLFASRQIDIKLLKRIAEITGGRFFFGGNLDELRKIYQRIEELEPRPSDSEYQRPQYPLFPLPLALALVLSVWVLLWEVYGDLGHNLKGVLTAWPRRSSGPNRVSP